MKDMNTPIGNIKARETYIGSFFYLADITQQELEVEVSMWKENQPIREKMDTLILEGRVSL